MKHLTLATLNLYLDGELDVAARAAAEAHLFSCRECQRELGALQSLFAELDALPPEAMSIDLTARVLAEVAARPSPWWVAAPAFVLIAQLVLGMILAAWLISTMRGSIAGDLADVAGYLAPRWPGSPTANVGAMAWHALTVWLAGAEASYVALVHTMSRLVPNLGAAEWAIGFVALGAAWLMATRVLIAGIREPSMVEVA
jgi:anti-sigma factor RsiW